MALAAGALIFLKQEKTKTAKMIEKEDAMVEESEGVDDTKMMADNSYMGSVIAGTQSPYVEFSEDDYEKALQEGKTVVLNFYANWCPICRGEAPEIESGFESLNDEQIIGFRVNYNDSDTDENEKKLAEQFKVPYQHTKIILKDGKEVYRDNNPWDKEMFLKTIKAYR